MAQCMYYYTADDMKTAATKCEQALALSRQGSEDTLLLGLLTNLASVYYMLERDAEAKKLWDEALEHAQRHYGPKHPHLALVLGNLGVFEANLGDTKKAIAHFDRALAIQDEALGPHHLMTAMTHKRIGELLDETHGDPATIDAHFKLAVADLATAYPDGNPELRDALLSYAIFKSSQKDYAAALALYERGLASERDANAKDDPSIFKLVHGVGSSHLELGHPAEAIPHLRRALALRLRNDRASVQSLVWIERDLARALAETGKRGEARQLAASALARLRTVKGDYATEIKELEQFIATL
jgi:tetratricopeptide (TPR) repeat protein